MSITAKQLKTKQEMENLRNKVEAKLIKAGNNVNDVKKMMDLHFDYASKTYTSVKTIAECIRVIY
jgi:hypothetical protein